MSYLHIFQNCFQSFVNRCTSLDFRHISYQTFLSPSAFYKLNQKYFGEGVIIDEQIKYEWARIPHFYTSFYVYKYATGISVACKIVKDILDKKENALDNYITFLSSGGSNYPLEILKKVDIDIINDDTIDKALEMYRETLEEFKKLT